MAISADIKNIQTDVTNISNASWNWHALTSDAKIVNRTCYGLVLQWLPKSIIPSWFKRTISNADVSVAYEKVKDKIVTLLASQPSLQATCDKATANMNALIDKINKARPKNEHLIPLNILDLKRKAEAQAAALTQPGSANPPSDTSSGPVGSPPGSKKPSSKVGTPDPAKTDATTKTPEQPSRGKSPNTPAPGRTTPTAPPEESTPSTVTNPNRRRSKRFSDLPARTPTPRRASSGKTLAPLYKGDSKGESKGKKSGK